ICQQYRHHNDGLHDAASDFFPDILPNLPIGLRGRQWWTLRRIRLAVCTRQHTSDKLTRGKSRTRQDRSRHKDRAEPWRALAGVLVICTRRSLLYIDMVTKRNANL